MGKWLIFGLLVGFTAHAEQSVIYGDDSRMEVYEVEEAAMQKAVAATAGLFTRHNLVSHSQDMSEIRGDHYGDYYQLCSSERFFHQTSSALCSAFLVADNLMVTAGHCMRDQYSCDEARISFDYELTSSGHDPHIVSNQSVYRCSEILVSKRSKLGADYAIFQLDRPVTDREPLKIASGEVNLKSELFSVGHPLGLPKKVISGGYVRRNDHPDFFVTNLDTYKGNSGSPVINRETMEVEGLLVRGEEDFERRGSCYVSKKCSNNDCRGEDVTKASVLMPEMERLLSSRLLSHARSH